MSYPSVGFPPDSFGTNDIINNRYVVQQRLGDGAFSVVYQVYDSKVKRNLALKIFKDATGTDDKLVSEYHILADLLHPHIGRVFHAEQILDTPIWFLILEYLEGQPLASLIRERKLTTLRSIEIASQILQGLDHVHSRGLYHRDVKPSNIIVTATGAKLIDFNIARSADDSRLSRTGTIPYMAPDIREAGWDASGDTYGLGLCLYEMLTCTYPFSGYMPSYSAGVPDPKALNPRLSREVADVVIRAIQPYRADRFSSAREMLNALSAVTELEEPPPPVPGGVDWGAMGIDAAEFEAPGHNPILRLFMSLYSQSKGTNVGTRGLDPFTRHIYVPTRIDRELKPAILRGEFRLVIITGNAGDGKTAFIQTLEDDVTAQGIPIERDPSGNGARFVVENRRFVTNYDGSQDEGETTNDDVLDAFFAPFQGHDWGESDPGETRVIAINQGRLQDFLLQHRRVFTGLRGQVTRFFDEDREPSSGLAIVNLNLRAVTAGTAEDPSIFDRLLDTFTDPVYWTHCAGCDLAHRCYVPFNVHSVRDPIYGEQVRHRLRRLFTVAHDRGQLHLTIRDLRSALAYSLFGIRDCPDIRQMADDPAQRLAFLGYHYYNTPFADSTANGPVDGREPRAVETSGDRLIGLLSQADVAEVANPRLDAELNTVPPMIQPHFPAFNDRSENERSLLQELFDDRPTPGEGADDDKLAVQRAFHAFARRKTYFERPDQDTIEMLPFTTFARFDNVVSGKVLDITAMRKLIANALSASEDLHHAALRDGYVCLRVGTERKATIKSIRRFPIRDFKVEVPRFERLTRFVEFQPASFSFVHRSSNAIRLSINLDLFEMLDRINRGFTPSIEELRGPFVNILIFKRQLEALSYEELLLTPDDQTFYQVTKHSDQALELTPVELG